MKEIAFTKVSLPYGWLGNMSPYPLEHEGRLYRTAEALFQASRFDDEQIRERIRREISPMGAKMVAKKYADKMVVLRQSPRDVVNMRIVLKLKLEQHHGIALALKETGAALLIEDCTARPHGSGLFWGMARSEDGWRGENWLGKLWMDLREEMIVGNE